MWFLQKNQKKPKTNLTREALSVLCLGFCLSWPKLPPGKDCGRTAGVFSLGWEANDSC